MVAPFISAYIHIPTGGGITRLLECRTCGHRWFEDRFDDEEMDRLYSGYRGQEYLSVRMKHEPWYTAKINSANHDQVIIKQRKEGLLRFLSQAIPGDVIQTTIADIGGDAGQFIPLELARHAFLVEASDQRPTPGVIRVNSISDIPYPINLVICSHVLEHIPSPARFIADITRNHNLSRDCLFYIEVPLEQFRISALLRHSIYRKYIGAVLAVQWLAVGIDFLSVVARSYIGMIFPPLIIKLHEHINFFTLESLRSLVNFSGLEVINEIEEKGSTLSTHQGVIRLLARKKNPI
jgi:Methyltransferase domain